MSRAIDFEKARLLIMDAVMSGFDIVLDQIEEQCAVDPESLRPTGQWEYMQDDEWRCSNCHTIADTDGRLDRPMKKFCDECGAKMEGWKCKY